MKKTRTPPENTLKIYGYEIYNSEFEQTPFCLDV